MVQVLLCFLLLSLPLLSPFFSSLLLCLDLCYKLHSSWSGCPLAGLVCALSDAGQVSAGSPWSVLPPSLTATPVLSSTFASSARKTFGRGLADSYIGLASSPSPVRASHCTPNCGRASRIASRTSSSSDVIAKKIVELRRFQSERLASTSLQISGNQICALARTVARSRANLASVSGACGMPHLLLTHFSTLAPLIAARITSFTAAAGGRTPCVSAVSAAIRSAHASLSSTHSSRSFMRLPSRASLVRSMVGCELLMSISI